MGLLVDKVVPEDKIQAAVTAALQANQTDANDPARVAYHVAAAKRAAKPQVTYHWPAIVVGIIVGAVLLIVGIGLQVYADNWAADQAMKVASVKGYAAPTSGLPGIATTVIALASAWSGGLVGLVLGTGES